MSPHPEGTHCETVLDRLEAWVDGDLDHAALAQVESHLEGCAACRDEASMAREIRAELREMPRYDTPEVVLARVRAQARAEHSARGGSRFRWRSCRSAG